MSALNPWPSPLNAAVIGAPSSPVPARSKLAVSGPACRFAVNAIPARRAAAMFSSIRALAGNVPEPVLFSEFSAMLPFTL